VNNIISGAGNVFIDGSQPVTLTAANTYSGGTTVDFNTTLGVGNDSALGTGGLILRNSATLRSEAAGLTIANAIILQPGTATIDTQANTMTLDGAISGAGGLSKTGTGSLTLTAASTYIGATTVTGGTLNIAGGASITSNVTNDATFNNAGTVTGSVVNNSFASSGGTITGGVANFFNFTASGTINGNITNSGAGLFTVAGNLSSNGSAFNNGNGTASLRVTGGDFTGIGTLTNSSLGLGTGVAVAAGRTLGAASIINDVGATFLNNGTVNSNLTVNGGTVLGNGTFVGNSTFNGGNLAPGNSIGTLNFQGNLTLTAATTYLLEVDPNGSDLTRVTGTATLGGATVSATYANGSYITRRYTILNATGGVIGTFSSLVNTNLPANFTTALSYDANNAYLDLTLNFAPPDFGSGLSGNQASVANALIRSFNTAGGIPLAFGALTPQGLTQVSGEAATGTQQTTFDAMGQFLNVMTDPFTGERGMGGASSYTNEGAASAYASKRKGRDPAEQDAYAAMVRKAPPRAPPFARRWSVWAAGYGGTQSTDGDAAVGSNDVIARIYGAAAGFDYRLTPATLVGFSLGGAGTKYDLANGVGGGRSEMFQAGVYGRHDFGAAYVAGALAWGWQDVTTDRNVFLSSLRANFDANAVSGRLEGGYRYAFDAGGLTPYAAGQFTTFFLPGYAEQVVAGSNLFALAYAEKNVTASRSELGLRGDTSFAMQDAIVTLRGRAAWAHNFNTDRSVTAIFQSLPASAFVVNGAAQAENSALVTASAETRWRNGFSVAASFEGEFSNVTESYAGKGIVRYQW
jgi:autotransporter-associated beta strand protein